MAVLELAPPGVEDVVVGGGGGVPAPLVLAVRARVRVIDSVDEVQRLSDGHGGWNVAVSRMWEASGLPEEGRGARLMCASCVVRWQMGEYCGREGIVEEIDADGDVSVL